MPFQSPKPKPRANADPFAEGLVEMYAEKHGVNPKLVKGIADVETGFRGYDPTSISPAGARGTMQVMKGTGLRHVTPERFGTIGGQIEAGILETKRLSDKHGGDVDKIVHGYLGGARDPYTGMTSNRYANQVRSFLTEDEDDPFAEGIEEFRSQKATPPPANDAAAQVAELQTNQHVAETPFVSTARAYPEDLLKNLAPKERVDIGADSQPTIVGDEVEQPQLAPHAEGEAGLYKLWHDARREGRTADALELGRNYEQLFPTGKNWKTIYDEGKRLTQQNEKTTKAKGGGVDVPVDYIKQAREAGKGDDEILTAVRDALSERLGLAPGQVAYLTEKWGKHPLGRLTNQATGQPLTVDDILTAEKNGLFPFSVPPELLAAIEKEKAPEEPKEGLGSFAANAGRALTSLPAAIPRTAAMITAGLGSDPKEGLSGDLLRVGDAIQNSLQPEYLREQAAESADTWSGMFGSAAGSLVNALAGGAAMNTSKAFSNVKNFLPDKGVLSRFSPQAAAFGALQGGGQAFDEAVKAGATREQALANGILNTLISLSEGVGIEGIADNVALKRYAASKAKEAVIGFGENFTQETFQGVASDAAKQLTYDPKTKTFSTENLIKNLKSGVIGGVLGAGGGVLGSTAQRSDVSTPKIEQTNEQTSQQPPLSSPLPTSVQDAATAAPVPPPVETQPVDAAQDQASVDYQTERNALIERTKQRKAEEAAKEQPIDGAELDAILNAPIPEQVETDAGRVKEVETPKQGAPRDATYQGKPVKVTAEFQVDGKPFVLIEGSLDAIPADRVSFKTAQATDAPVKSTSPVENKGAEVDLIEPVTVPEPAKPAEKLSRNFRAGTNDAEMVFASPEQRDLYDLAAKLKYQTRGGQNKTYNRSVGDIAGLKKSLSESLGIPESEVTNRAYSVYDDVRAQMKGVKHLESRQMIDKVTVPEAKGQQSVTETKTPIVSESKFVRPETLEDAIRDGYLTNSPVNRKLLEDVAKEAANPRLRNRPATAQAEKILKDVQKRFDATNPPVIVKNAKPKADESSSLSQIIRNSGGLKTGKLAGKSLQAGRVGKPLRSVESGELDWLRESPMGKQPGFFNNSGLTLDDMRGIVNQYGFEFETVSDLLKALDEEARGNRQYSVQKDYTAEIAKVDEQSKVFYDNMDDAAKADHAKHLEAEANADLMKALAEVQQEGMSDELRNHIENIGIYELDFTRSHINDLIARADAVYQKSNAGNLAETSRGQTAIQESPAHQRQGDVEGRLSTEQVDRVKELSKTLKEQGTTVDDYLNQQGMFGDELNPQQQELLRELSKKTEKAPVKEKQQRLISEEAYRNAEKKLGGGGLKTGIDPEDIKSLAIIAAYHIESGARNFADFSKRMLEDLAELAEDIKPHLQKLWDDYQAKKGTTETPHHSTTQPRDESTKQFVKAEETTGIKNAVVEEERAARGLSPVMKEARKAAGVTFDAGKEIVDADPNFRDRVAAWAKNPKNLTDDETAAALYDRARLHDEHKTTMEQILAAREKGDTIAEATAREALDRIEKQRDDNDRAVTHSGTQNARALAFRRFLVKEDYSLANLVQRAKVAHQGGEISEKTRAKLEKHAKELADLQEQFDKRGERIAELEAERAVKNIEKTVSRQSRQTKRAVTKQELDVEYADLSKQFFAAASKLSANPLADPTLYSLIGKIAQNRVKAGFNTASGLVDEVYNTIKDQVKGVTKRDVRDAISGYGMPRKTKNQIDSELTKVKRELRKLSKEEDADPATEAAKAEASKRKAQKTRLENRLSELDAMLTSKAYYKNPDGSPSMTKPRNPLALDVGALKTQREITMKKALIEQDFRKMKRESILDTITHTRQSAMLANVVGITQDIVNTTAHNVTATLQMVPETILDIAQSRRTGQRTSALRGAKPFRSVGAGLKKAASESKLVFKTGVSERMAQEQEIPHESYTGEGKTAQVFDGARNMVSRIRTIADLPNFEVAMEIERRRHSRAMAETERLQGKIQKGDIEARANDIYNDISLSDQADIVLDAATAVAKQEATDEARFRTFKHDNPFSQMIQQAANSPKTPPAARFALRLIIPFEKAMSNYVKAGFDMTGAGVATGLTRALLNIARGNRQALFGKDRHVIADPATLRQRQKAANRAFGRGITGGAGGLLLGYTLAGLGVIGNPKDDENKKKGRVASLHVLGESFDLSWLGPLALPLAMGAGYYHDQFGGATRAFGKGIQQAPAFRGSRELNNTGRLFESKDLLQGAGTLGGRLTSSFIPGVVKDAAKLSDFGKDRDAKGFTPQIQQNIPFWRKKLPERGGSSSVAGKF